MTRRRSRQRAGGDGLLTIVLVVLALAVGAFLSSTIYRWTSGSRSVTAGAPGVAARAVPAGATVPADADGTDRARIRVEVLNGARIPGLAWRMTGLLRSRGFDVVNYGNATGDPRKESAILDRVGNQRFARAVALELPGTPIRREPAPGGFIDITVILGEDSERFFTHDPSESGPAAGPAPTLLGRLRALLGL